MSSERAKILRMIAEGTITPEEGEKLLSRLDPTASAPALVAPQPAAGNGTSRPIKYLRVVVEGKDKANVRVPIALIRTGIKLSALMPLSASEHLTEHGIDLSQFNNLDGDELMEALRELKVDVETEDGDIVHIFCE